jgi:hypothetical protein
MSAPDRYAEAIRAERESVLEHARGAILIAYIGGAINQQDWHRLDHELCEAADFHGATRH